MTGELPLRVVVERPPDGVVFRVQRGKAQLLEPAGSAGGALSFDFTVRVVLAPGELPNFLGEFAQGPRDKRFIYVNSGQGAGQHDSPWSRRAKLPLMKIPAALVKRVLADPDSVLEVRIEGVGRDGGPACATVPLLDGGWVKKERQ
jgi:uncharacterized protein DUF5990